MSSIDSHSLGLHEKATTLSSPSVHTSTLQDSKSAAPPLRHIDTHTHLPYSGGVAAAPPTDSSIYSPGTASIPSSPPPPYPPHASGFEEANTVSLQFLSTYASSSEKLNHLQGLMSSLHTVMQDQSITLGDLKAHLDELHSALDRVAPMMENMTANERQVLQNAQMMKALAEEILTTKRPKISMLEASPKDTPASLSLSTVALAGRTFDPTEAPPPTASTPPPATSFARGHYLRHSSSTASFASSASSDRQYTHDLGDRPSRPSSVASSHRRTLRRKSRHSLRQLEPLSDQQEKKTDEESNASFDRICSLLTHLITDASTAVSTAPDGAQQQSSSVVPLPLFSPLVQSDIDSSAESGSDDYDEHQDEAINGTYLSELAPVPKPAEGEEISFMQRLQGPEGLQVAEDFEVEVEEAASNKFKSRRRALTNQKSTKRLSSLFTELQNTQQDADVDPSDHRSQSLDLDRDESARRTRDSIISTASSSALRRSTSQVLPSRRRSSTRMSTRDSLESGSLSPQLSLRLRKRASFSSVRSEMYQRPLDLDILQPAAIVPEVDTELGKTVETIDGLTRDIVAVASHQNLMQIKLQRTLQFQKQQIEQIEQAHSSIKATPLAKSRPSALRAQDGSDNGLRFSDASDSEASLHPLADLSKSLKQVAVSVGKVISSTRQSHSQRSKEHPAPQSRSSTNNDTTRPSNKNQVSRISGKDFSHYFQELEKIAALGGKIGFGKVETEYNGGAPVEQRRATLDTMAPSSSEISSRESTLNAHDGFAKSFASLNAQLDADEQFEELDTTASTSSSTVRSDHSYAAPPGLEDFAAQCRLLTKALVLPFVQLTHHAMTSQDSALALTPRSGRFADSTKDLDAALEIVENFETLHTLRAQGQTRHGEFSSSSTRSSSRFRTPKSGVSSSPLSPSLPDSPQLGGSHPLWSAAALSSLSGQELDSILRENGEISADAVVKAKTFISTGLYLIHLLYWTVLFIIGTLVLDPWLAETAGQQLVRIVEQVRETVARDGQQHQAKIGLGDNHEEIAPASLPSPQPASASMFTETVANEPSQDLDTTSRPDGQNGDDDDTSVQNRIQALEDRAIEVAVGFETLKQRLGSSPSHSRSNSRALNGLWSRQSSFHSVTSALTATTLTGSTNFGDLEQPRLSLLEPLGVPVIAVDSIASPTTTTARSSETEPSTTRPHQISNSQQSVMSPVPVAAKTVDLIDGSRFPGLERIQPRPVVGVAWTRSVHDDTVVSHIRRSSM